MGANSFLAAEYKMCAIFVAVSAPLIAMLIARGSDNQEYGLRPMQQGMLSATSFTVGALTSMLSGYIGMRVAVYANARCTVGAIKPAPAGWTESFNTAFRAGGVMGFSLCGLALLCLYALLCVYSRVGAAPVHLPTSWRSYGHGLGRTVHSVCALVIPFTAAPRASIPFASPYHDLHCHSLHSHSRQSRTALTARSRAAHSGSSRRTRARRAR